MMGFARHLGGSSSREARGNILQIFFSGGYFVYAPWPGLLLVIIGYPIGDRPERKE